MRRIAVLDAPSNLGLRPPTATSVPGCAKAPGALRDHGLLTRLGARDAGCLTPPRYDPGDWRPGDGVAHATQIAAYSRALADRIGAILDAGEFPVVLGGDCSILLGSGMAMHRLGEAVGGRIGLVFVDGHSDFRHPGNASYVGAAAGEDLALVDRPRPGRPGGDRGPPALLPRHRRGGAGHPRPGRVPAGPAGGRASSPGRCRRCAPRARPAAPSGPATSWSTARATGCTSTSTCSTRR